MRSVAGVALLFGAMLGCAAKDGAQADSKGSGGRAGLGGSASGQSGTAGAGGLSGSKAGKGSGAGTPGGGAAGSSGVSGADAAGSSDGGKGGARSGSGGSSSGEAGAGAGEPGAELMPLPAGSREVDGIVNLVDADAAAALDAYAVDDTQSVEFLRTGLLVPMNLFLEHYYEQYDFVFLFTDHEVADARFAGKFEAFNRPPAAGGGVDFEVALGGYRGNGRTRGAIAIPYFSQVGPPLSHETLHYWANYLDPSFGFGIGLTLNDPVHWGYAGVNGSLGGFDPASIRCATPAGAVPPGCTPESSGRTRYVVDFFGTNANGFRDAVYAPFELYLMGLISLDEAPSSIMLLTQAETVSEPVTTSDPLTIEADALVNLPLADIVARQGLIEEMPKNQRDFSAAFVVISAQPADDAVLAEIAGWAAAFGNRGSSQLISSFDKYTGGRATMNTLLGPRRSVDMPAPAARERFVCDLLAQDCKNPDWACYPFPPNDCVLSDGLGVDAPCTQAFACAPGLLCVSGQSGPVCKPFCDPTTSSGAKACDTLCPGSYQEVTRDNQPYFSVCVPP